MKPIIKVEFRKGFWSFITFMIAFILITPISVPCYWIGKGLIIVSELLTELYCRVIFKELKK